MKKIYKITLFLVAFLFLSTYSPNQLNLLPKKNFFFFKIKNIDIVNNRLINKNIIQKKLEHVLEKNIFFIKKEDVKIPLQSLNFLEKVEVKKKYPNTIVVKIYETTPIAILFKNGKKYILDNLSNAIEYDNNIINDDFPSIFGENAQQNFMSFFNKLGEKNFPKKRISNYYYFQIGRWDLKLRNEKIIKFPINKIDEAIIQSLDLIDRIDFQNYNIIDLRIDGKIVVQ